MLSARRLSEPTTGANQAAVLQVAIVLRHQNGGAALAFLKRSDVTDDVIDTQRKTPLIELPDGDQLFAVCHEAEPPVRIGAERRMTRKGRRAFAARLTANRILKHSITRFKIRDAGGC